MIFGTLAGATIKAMDWVGAQRVLDRVDAEVKRAEKAVTDRIAFEAVAQGPDAPKWVTESVDAKDAH